ncbi:MAG: right-handed parallel beta-helix repeat-containing protein [Deltaproteobacteria bacterium]|nr:right-handed parallel beta-helix repeat-containing protein [Deltaproteobacteria bacterium]
MLPAKARMCVAALWLFGAGSRAAFAADYWVKNGGDDGFDGLSSGSAWATLGHAANVVGAGDTVHVLDGSYQGFYLTTSGSAGNPITFKAEGSNVRITADNGITADGINLEGASYVVIDGFIVNDRGRTGIRTVINDHVTIRNCQLGNNGRWGILSGFSDDLTIENNVAHHSQAEHGIYVGNSGDRPIIRGNTVYSNHANGIHMNGDLSQGGDGQITGALVERNVIYDNGVAGGSGINMDGVSNSIVRNNLLYNNHASGISLYRIDGAAGSSNNLVVNNTVINASDGRWCININSAATGNTVFNNILYTYHSFRGVISIDASSRPGFTSDYNSVMSRFSLDQGDTVMSLGAWQALGYDVHSILATPADLFVDPAADFHLLITCPAVDAGTSSNAPANDLEGNPRPVGSGYDLGAYEWQLPLCNNGNQDPGEQCGEPGLACTDPCTSCQHCICAQNTPVCGDSLVCGNEQCESNGDCIPGKVCLGCQCLNPPTCTSGIPLTNSRLSLRANQFRLRASGRVVVPKPWVGIDPLNNGVRLVVDSTTSAGGLDVAIPGGVRSNGIGWKLSRYTWTYLDPTGSHAGIRRFTVSDRSLLEDGRLTFSASGRSGSIALPAVSSVRTTVVLGSAQECGTISWNPPTAPRPRCNGDASRLSCR